MKRSPTTARPSATRFFARVGDEYITDAFRLARAASAGAPLLQRLWRRGPERESGPHLRVAPESAVEGSIDGVGLQMHISATSRPSTASIAENVRRLAALGLIVHISEMDVSINNASGTDRARLEAQRAAYREVVGVCMMEPRCEAITFWGLPMRIRG